MLEDGDWTAASKDIVLWSILKKFTLATRAGFLGKVLERIMVGHPQVPLKGANYTDYLDPHQCGFQPGYETELGFRANLLPTPV